MGYTATEFAVTLARVFADWRSVAETPTRWRIAAHDVTARVEIAAQPPRRLGALVLPVLRVRIDFLTGDPGGQGRFLARFERGFHKGGG